MHALNLFLQAAAEAIRNGEFDQAERLIDECGRSSVILARLLNAVLDLSRLESGRVVPRYHVFDVRQIVEEAAEQLRPFALSRGVELRLRLPKDRRRLRAQRRALARAGDRESRVERHQVCGPEQIVEADGDRRRGALGDARAHRRAGQRHRHSGRLLRRDLPAVLPGRQSRAGSRQGAGARAVDRECGDVDARRASHRTEVRRRARLALLARNAAVRAVARTSRRRARRRAPKRPIRRSSRGAMCCSWKTTASCGPPPKRCFRNGACFSTPLRASRSSSTILGDRALSRSHHHRFSPARLQDRARSGHARGGAARAALSVSCRDGRAGGDYCAACLRAGCAL